MSVRKLPKRPLARGSIIVLSAPSGAGKSTLVRRLRASLPGLAFSVSHTTRAPRRGERNGREYFFVTPARFKRLVRAGEFVEWADVFGHLYGTSWRQLRAAQEAGRDILLDIDVQGHRQVRKQLPEAVSVFIVPPSFATLKRRLRKRHLDAPEAIERRLATARREMARWPEYNYVIVNDRLPKALAALRAVVQAARFRRANQQARVRNIRKTFGG